MIRFMLWLNHVLSIGIAVFGVGLVLSYFVGDDVMDLVAGALCLAMSVFIRWLIWFFHIRPLAGDRLHL